MSEALAQLPPLREVVADHGLGAKKSFGQHFLFDLNLTAKIARAAAPLEGSVVVEVGPGPGGLTRALLSEGAGHVLAIEKDARFLPALSAIGEAAPGRLTVAEADALKADEAALCTEAAPGLSRQVVANLPYNVGTALLVRWLTQPAWWTRLTLMFQAEVAERIVAGPGTPAYGRLAVLAALRAEPAFLFRVPARAFTPPPKVESAVVQLTPRADAFADVAALEAVTAAAFGQRRKMLRKSLASLAKARGLDVEAWLTGAGIAPDARPETVAPDAFAHLAEGLS